MWPAPTHKARKCWRGQLLLVETLAGPSKPQAASEEAFSLTAQVGFKQTPLQIFFRRNLFLTTVTSLLFQVSRSCSELTCCVPNLKNSLEEAAAEGKHAKCWATIKSICKWRQAVVALRNAGQANPWADCLQVLLRRPPGTAMFPSGLCNPL